MLREKCEEATDYLETPSLLGQNRNPFVVINWLQPPFGCNVLKFLNGKKEWTPFYNEGFHTIGWTEWYLPVCEYKGQVLAIKSCTERSVVLRTKDESDKKQKWRKKLVDNNRELILPMGCPSAFGDTALVWLKPTNKCALGRDIQVYRFANPDDSWGNSQRWKQLPNDPNGFKIQNDKCQGMVIGVDGSAVDGARIVMKPSSERHMWKFDMGPDDENCDVTGVKYMSLIGDVERVPWLCQRDCKRSGFKYFNSFADGQCQCSTDSTGRIVGSEPTHVSGSISCPLKDLGIHDLDLIPGTFSSLNRFEKLEHMLTGHQSSKPAVLENQEYTSEQAPLSTSIEDMCQGSDNGFQPEQFLQLVKKELDFNKLKKWMKLGLERSYPCSENWHCKSGNCDKKVKFNLLDVVNIKFGVCR